MHTYLPCERKYRCSCWTGEQEFLPVQIVSLNVSRSKGQVANSLKFMDKLLAKDVSKGRIQDIEAKEARDRITVLDYDTQGIKGFRDADMVIERSEERRVGKECVP